MKAKVVCKICNETWMSDIENLHAKTAMSDLILGKRVEEITADQAHSISLFAFKTAIIANHMLPEDEGIFDPPRPTTSRPCFIPGLEAVFLGREALYSGGKRLTILHTDGTALNSRDAFFSPMSPLRFKRLSLVAPNTHLASDACEGQPLSRTCDNAN